MPEIPWRAWKPIWRLLAASTVFAVLVAVAVVVFGSGNGKTPASTPAPRASAGKSQQAAPSGDDALVNRMLDQIRAGKPVEPQFAVGDNPAAGVAIEAIKAKPGEQLRLGELEIPRLGLRQPLNNGVDEAALVRGVGHWPGTPLPGSAGNSRGRRLPGLHRSGIPKADVLKAVAPFLQDPGKVAAAITL